MPGEPELAAGLDETVEQVSDNPRIEINLAEGGREKIVKALTGLTCSEAENALAKVIVTRSRLDPEDIDLLLAEKEQIIRKSGMLEFYSTPERFGSIGGLDNLKTWLKQRANILAIHLTKHHRDYRDFDLARHVQATDGFSGAETEQARDKWRTASGTPDARAEEVGDVGLADRHTGADFPGIPNREIILHADGTFTITGIDPRQMERGHSQQHSSGR